MPSSGLFITLSDRETLALYLARGVYGFHMRPDVAPSRYSRHYNALADYACAREDTHVFFFLKRRIVYGGQVVGSSSHGAFYLNGQHSPIGSTANAPLVWDESRRPRYHPAGDEGVFVRGDNQHVCQPYLILFRDRLGLAGKAIVSDDLYFELGDFPYPLPTNSISDMGFCTMTPAEVDITLRLMQASSEQFPVVSSEPVHMNGSPLPFSPDLGISELSDAQNEAHLEASLLANPRLFPSEVRPENACLCRQVPISPYKPSQMDRADICYYYGDIRTGSVPNVIIELKRRQAGMGTVTQVLRYARWLIRRLSRDAGGIRLYIMAPSFSRNLAIPREYENQISTISF